MKKWDLVLINRLKVLLSGTPKFLSRAVEIPPGKINLHTLRLIPLLLVNAQLSSLILLQKN